MKTTQRERGQSLVELALGILFLVFLLAGAVEFGIALFQYVQLRDAAQEGALYGAINPTQTSDIIARVRGSSTSPVDLADTLLVDVTPTVIGAACEGNSIQVTVEYDHVIFMPFVPQFIGNPTIPLNATVTSPILSPPCP